MRTEMKIVLPLWKMAYAFCFVLVLSLVRGVSYADEVGLALEPPLAALAVAFVSDTCVRERVSKRSEVWKLYSLEKKKRAVFRRMAVQEIFLLLLAVSGYGMFFMFQQPAAIYGTDSAAVNDAKPAVTAFFFYLLAIAVTLVFWGMLSLLLSCVCKSQWAAIGGGMVLWIAVNSVAGDAILGKWNPFSYTFREIGAGTGGGEDMSWLCGKMLCVLLCAAMALAFPAVWERRMEKEYILTEKR